MIRAISILAVSFLILIVSGCANTVQKPTVQQHYLVVTMTMYGNVDINQYRYFVFLKYNASGTSWPDLTNQTNHILSLPNASTGIEGVSTGYLQNAVNSNFQFDEFYEYSKAKNISSGTFANVISSPNPTVILTYTNPSPTLQFAIPLNTASSPIGINVVTTTYSPNPPDCAIQDYVPTYYNFSNVLGNNITPPQQLLPIPTPGIASSADIISWSASII